MRIIAKAKPIRIRIKSGGEEHFSLDSLRCNLCVQDLWPLIKDHRLSRWLMQLGETELAHSVDSLSCEELEEHGYFYVLKLFLKERLDNPQIIDIYSLFEYWHSSTDRGSKNYISLQNFLLSTYKGVKFLYPKYKDDFPKEKWWDVFCQFEEEADPALLFAQGSLAFNGFTHSNGTEFRDVVRGMKLIENAAELGDFEAVTLVKSNQILLRRRESMLTPEVRNKIQLQIDRWKVDKLGYINKVVSSDEEIVKETKLLLREFTSLLQTYDIFPNSLLVREVKQKLENLEKSKLFYVENRFVLELLLYKYAKNDASFSNLFVDLANKYNYPLAKYMINPPKNNLIDGYNFREKHLYNQLGFVLDHLFDY